MIALNPRPSLFVLAIPMVTGPRSYGQTRVSGTKVGAVHLPLPALLQSLSTPDLCLMA